MLGRGSPGARKQTILHPSFLRQVLQELEDELHLPATFLEELGVEKDDWALIIKGHALIEAAVSHQLSEALLDKRLMPIFEQLPLGERNYEKLKCARRLELLTKEYCDFIGGLSSLRNKIAHNVSEVHFTFEKWVGTLDKNQAKEWAKRFDCFAETEEDRQAWRAKWSRRPQEALWLGMLKILSRVIGTSGEARRERQKVGHAMMDSQYLREHVLRDDANETG